MRTQQRRKQATDFSFAHDNNAVDFWRPVACFITCRDVSYNYEMPDGPAAVERASRPCRYSFSTDANAAFNAFRIHEDSQQYFTIWLPDGDSPADGASKYSMRRLGFGFRNSPANMVEWYDQMRA